MGACCSINFGCSDQPTEADCTGLLIPGQYYPDCDCSDGFCTKTVCCHPDEDFRCDTMTATECTARGGVPVVTDRCCASVNCRNLEGYGACCHEDGTCEDGVPSYACGNEDFPGTVYWDRQACRSAAYPTGIDCDNPDPISACCYEDGDCVPSTELECVNRNGAWQRGSGTGGVPCELADCEQPELPGCRQSSKTPTPVPPYSWTTDLCALALMLPIIRNASQYPTGPNAVGWGSAFLFEPVSKDPIRAIESALTRADPEPCRYHFGGIVRLPNGMFAPALCSQPFNGKENAIELSVGSAAMVRRVDDDRTREAGKFYWAMTYHAPFWTEAEFFTRQAYCPGIG